MIEQNNFTDNTLLSPLNNDDIDDCKNIPVPHVNKKQYDYNNLVKWLQLCCDGSNDAFKDQNYSESYMDMFNITDTDGIFYQNGDIDHKLNIGYVDYLLGDVKHPNDKELECFIDYVPVREKDTDTISTYHNIVILPGTNHSNSNYIYKIIKNESNKNKYTIPYLNNNPRIPYTGDKKEADMMINKEEVYKFIKDNSKNRRY